MSTNKYRFVSVDGKEQLLHRALWEAANGTIPEGMQIDHINGNTLDNRLENLRVVTHQENARNQKRRNDNTSGVTGVSWNKKKQKWEARITDNGKLVFLGLHDDWFEAVCARKSAEKRLGYHENHGRVMLETNKDDRVRRGQRHLKQRNNTSGVNGVSWDKKSQKWRPRISDDNGKHVHLGRYADLADAVNARKAAEAQLGYAPDHGKLVL